jgi:GAF domain-containing protein
VVGRVAQTDEPLIFEDIDADPRYAAFSRTKAAQSARRRFFAVFPIKSQSRIFGVITFNGEAPRKLTSDEIRLLTSMCEQLGVAVEKASLFDQIQTRSRHLAVLNTIGNAVSQSLDLQKILKEALDKSRRPSASMRPGSIFTRPPPRSCISAPFTDSAKRWHKRWRGEASN